MLSAYIRLFIVIPGTFCTWYYLLCHDLGVVETPKYPDILVSGDHTTISGYPDMDGMKHHAR